MTKGDICVICGGILCGMSFQQNLLFIVGLIGVALVMYGTKEEE